MIEAHVKIARDGKTLGEYSLSDLGRALRSKAVLLTDHYWRPGMKEWASVEAIAKEAEEAVPTSDAPTPPRLPSSGWAKLHILLGICAVIISISLWDRAEGVKIEWSRQADIYMDYHPERNINDFKFDGRGVGNYRSLFRELVPLTLIMWIVSRFGFFVVWGDNRSADIKLLRIGDAFFAGALMNVAFAAYRFLIQPGYLNCWQLIGLG